MRKPYKRVMANDWFLQNAYYRLYMVREFTCVIIAFYVLNLMAGVAALGSSDADWTIWVVSQRNPVMMLLALATFGAGMWHAVTWFQTMPKVIKIAQGDHFVPAKTIVLACYVLWGAVSLVLLALVLIFAHR